MDAQTGWILVGIIGIAIIAAVIVAVVSSVVSAVAGSDEDQED